jgi:hypothetical protein
VKSHTEPIVWQCECYRAAGEKDERQRGSRGVKPVGAADDELRLVVQRLGASVAQRQATGSQDPGFVFADGAAEADERRQAAAGQAREEPVDQLLDGGDAQAGLEDLADGLFVRPGAGDLAARGLQRGEGGGLAVGEVFGVLQQRPAGVLERLRGVAGAGGAQLVPVLAADLVQRLGGEVGSARGAVAAFRPLRFRGPPAEPVTWNST